MPAYSVSGSDEQTVSRHLLIGGAFEDWSKGGRPGGLLTAPPAARASGVQSPVRDYYAPWQVMAIYEWLMTDPSSPLAQPDDGEMTRAALALGFPTKE